MFHTVVKSIGFAELVMDYHLTAQLCMKDRK
jgi:hypothetical protein